MAAYSMRFTGLRAGNRDGRDMVTPISTVLLGGDVQTGWKPRTRLIQLLE